MDNAPQKLSRKKVLSGLIVLPVLGVLIATTTLPAEAKSSQAAAKYQDTPKGKAQCSNCALFIPGKSSSAMGTCKVVDGAISPKGWCQFYAAKS